MSVAVETVVVLHAPGRRLHKRVFRLRDGALDVASYDKSVTNFDLHAIPVVDLPDFRELLGQLLNAGSAAIIRGAVADLSRTRDVRRLYVPERDSNGVVTYPATIIDVPRRLLALDVENIPMPAGVAVTDLTACAAVAIAMLPTPFHDAACIVQATGSHGFRSDMRLRLFYWLSRPTWAAEIKRWIPAITHAGKIVCDPSVLTANQIIYTSRPSLPKGVADPIPVRIVDLPGMSEVQVPAPEMLGPPPRPVPVYVSTAPAARGWFEKKARFRFDDAVMRVGMAQDGAKHNTLLREARLVGGLLHYGISEGEATARLLGALPVKAQDRSAAQTVKDGLAMGRNAPIELPGPPSRPSPSPEFCAMADQLVANMVARRGTAQ